MRDKLDDLKVRQYKVKKMIDTLSTEGNKTRDKTTARGAALSHPPHSLCSGRPGALAERPGQTSSRGESVASSLARLAGEQPK